MSEPKDDLLHYLRQGRRAVLRGLDGLSEYDARRPLVPSGANVLGLVKHLAGLEYEYLGLCAGRPGETLAWVDDGSIEQGADMWATTDQTREEIVALYQRACAHADATIAALPYDAPAHVPWWPPEHRATTLGHLLARMVAETAQHAGHVDVLRETVDGRVHDDLTDEQRRTYLADITAAAEPFRAS